MTLETRPVYSVEHLTHRDFAAVKIWFTIGEFDFKAEGVAKRSPEDEPDEELGYLIALERALEVLHRKVKRVADGKRHNQDHKAKRKLEKKNKVNNVNDVNDNPPPKKERTGEDVFRDAAKMLGMADDQVEVVGNLIKDIIPMIKKEV